MRTILNLIVLAALAVAVVEYVLPALRGDGSRADRARVRPAAEESGVWDCVAAASAANDNLSAATRAAAEQVGSDRASSTVVTDARAEIESARARCTCEHVACGKAEQALDALEAVVDSYAGILSGTGVSNPATAKEQVIDLLAEAREAAAAEG
jgi:hypothetical protein